MGTRTYVYTFTGAEGTGSEFYFSSIQQFDGTFTVTFTLNTPATELFDFYWGMRGPGGPTPCWQDLAAINMGATTTTETWTVGIPSGPWHCTDWDTFFLKLYSIHSRAPNGSTLTVEFTGDGIVDSLGFCQYGTRQKDNAQGILDAIPWLVSQVAANPIARWLFPMATQVMVKPIVLSALCSGLPPPDEDLGLNDYIQLVGTRYYTDAHRKVFVKMQRMAWDQYCECTPAPGGSPPPVGPGVTNINQPTWYITNYNYDISNYDIANTLNLILNYAAGNQYITNTTGDVVNNNTLIINDTNDKANELADGMCPPKAFVSGSVHSGLTGSGRIALAAGVVGFRVETLAHDTSKPVLSGDPPYLWDVGWVSTIGLGDELVDEKRVTRSAYLWFPCGLKHAASLGYRLRDEAVCRVTQLVVPGGGLEPP